MAKERPLKIEIPKPADERPAWSRVGIIGAAGFVLGIAWPKATGVKVGPNVPGDLRPQAEATAQPSAAPTAAPAAPPTAAPTAAPEAPQNKQTVAVGPGKITRCWDKKSKKLTDCGELQVDNIALPKLKDLAACPSAVGLAGKLTVAIDIDFDKKEVNVTKPKKEKTSIPSSTVTGIVQCAARSFANLPLEEVPHKYKHYTLQYGLTFTPPGKSPEEAAGDKDGAGGEDAVGSTTSETGAEGTATVIQDTGLVRKEPKDGEVVARLVRGTQVKIVGRRNEWYKIEASGKTGWIYRGAIGL
ncbi:SH3 domain-containing protein [Polyangium aurulentum]|uniref:SH3 domain-containing protein n=1 Tax=Polyangium aurulentum TaxID=2567896 RepID=UPI0010AE1F53|nr:SH3 domain-containing protein [Polyangium aurulentum]UQA58891.1 SH3 domain-containing protein [Polyangium aurulentum]